MTLISKNYYDEGRNQTLLIPETEGGELSFSNHVVWPLQNYKNHRLLTYNVESNKIHTLQTTASKTTVTSIITITTTITTKITTTSAN